jgi:hypothetical protein
VGFQFGSLLEGRNQWTASALKELEHGQHEHGTSPRYREGQTPTEEQHALQDLRDKLKDALAGGIQAPSTFQSYHKFHDFNNNSTFYQWLQFLKGNYPQFCSFKEDMFFYNAQTEEFRANDGLLSAIRRCREKGRVLVGQMLIETRHDELQADKYHANAIIIDTLKNRITRFEPHGRNSRSYESQALDSEFQHFIKNEAYGLETYQGPINFCALTGPQSRGDRKDYWEFEETKSGWKDRGWCVVFSLMFIHYRLAHPEESDREVELMLSHKSGGQLAMDIRSYANSVVRNVDPWITQEGKYLSTSVRTQKTPDGYVNVKAIMGMKAEYPRTRFRRHYWASGKAARLIRIIGYVSDDVLVVTELSTKMDDGDPRAKITPSDSRIIDDAELIMFAHLFQTLAIGSIEIELANGFDWETLAIRQDVRDLAARGTLDPDESHSGMSPSKIEELQSVIESAKRQPQRQRTSILNVSPVPEWIQMESIRGRADYYERNLGFTIESNGVPTIVTTTRQNIMSRYEDQKARESEIEPNDESDSDFEFESNPAPYDSPDSDHDRQPPVR